ncbi:MAG: anti-sigma factor domain-containing protein [Syntrophomonadales bacterium]|jgi:hypothetical protein
MARVKGIVLQQTGHRITVFTENGEFKSYSHRGKVQPGQEIYKRDYGELVVYGITTLLLFALAVSVFYILLTSAP